MFELMIIVLAIENIADILTNHDLFISIREWFERIFKKIGEKMDFILRRVPFLKRLLQRAGRIFNKLTTCKYCQMFWLSLIFFCLWMPPSNLMLAFAAHRIATLVSEFYDRYLNRAPISVFVQQPTVAEESDSLQK